MAQNFKIYDFKELVNMPNSNQAKTLLEKLVKVSSGILIKNKWKVGILKEFNPENKSLFGMNENRGNTIFIRLRDPNDQNSFLPWYFILGTLAHEIAHNKIQNHSAEFYKLMDELTDAMESEKDSLINNTQKHEYKFDGKFNILGGGIKKNRFENSAMKRETNNTESKYCSFIKQTHTKNKNKLIDRRRLFENAVMKRITK